MDLGSRPGTGMTLTLTEKGEEEEQGGEEDKEEESKAITQQQQQQQISEIAADKNKIKKNKVDRPKGKPVSAKILGLEFSGEK